jgi:hypothetical protein
VGQADLIGKNRDGVDAELSVPGMMHVQTVLVTGCFKVAGVYR